MDEMTIRLLLEGGALGILVFLVIYQGRQGGADRRQITAILDRFIKYVEGSEKIRSEATAARAIQDLKVLDRVNQTLIEMTKALSELARIMSAHDARNDMANDDLAASMTVIIEKLDKAIERQ